MCGAVTASGDDRVRVRLDLAYDGTDFSGWAVQPGLRTVEGELCAALGTILRIEPPRLTVGGRTDAGVHARGSVAHADLPSGPLRELPSRGQHSAVESALTRLAGVLPKDIAVRAVSVAPPGFDARFSALDRRYSYRICDRTEAVDPLRRRDTLRYRRALDDAVMDEAARKLTGLHDFAAFCRPREGASTVRTLLSYRWARDPDGVLVATVVADAFCHGMVRALVGAVVVVGSGREDVGWPERVRAGRARHPGSPVMAAHGLTLEEVRYPEADEDVAARAREARAVRTLPLTTPVRAAPRR